MGKKLAGLEAALGKIKRKDCRRSEEPGHPKTPGLMPVIFCSWLSGYFFNKICMRWIVLSICLIALAPGCAKTTPKGAKTSTGSPVGHNTAPASGDAPVSRPIVTPSNDTNGKVISVNQKARYAVLSYAIGSVPAVD